MIWLVHLPHAARWAPGFPQLSWGVPLCVTAHNLEEALGAGEFLGLTGRLRPGFLAPGRNGFLALLALITLPVWVIAAIAARGDVPPGGLAGVLVWVQVGFGFNAVAPHLYLSLRLRRYTPGVATAALLNLPFAIYLLHRTLEAGYARLLL